MEHYGIDGTIGLIIVEGGMPPEMDFHRYCPEGVAILSHGVPFKSLDPKGLADMGNYVEDAARMLMAGRPDIIVYSCTSGSFVKGAGYDQELIRRIRQATGVKNATTTSTSVLKAFHTMGITRIVMATPYTDEVNAIETRFLEDNGITVLASKGLGFTNDPATDPFPGWIPHITTQQMHDLAKEILTPQAEGVFISCAGLGISEGIPFMEKDFGVPVFTSNQCTIWNTLRMLSITENIGLGSLFHV